MQATRDHVLAGILSPAWHRTVFVPFVGTALADGTGASTVAGGGERTKSCPTSPVALTTPHWSVSFLLERVWQLRENLSAHDAGYVALAESLGCSLVTADARIRTTSGSSSALGAGRLPAAVCVGGLCRFARGLGGRRLG
jgi:hypothetical protein